VCFVVLHSSQDHLRTVIRDLDHHISYRCKKTPIVGVLGRGICSMLFPLDVLMVSLSTIIVAADGERLTCSEFSLGETIHLGNFEFTADYFGGLSLTPRRGDACATSMGSTRNGASTLRWAMIEDSTEEFLTTSSGEGSFGLPSPRRHDTGASLSPITITPWLKDILDITVA
jgi:hypothetical protein